MSEHIDVDTSGLLQREITLDQAGDKLLENMLRTANGRLTAAEALGHREFVMTRLYESRLTGRAWPHRHHRVHGRARRGAAAREARRAVRRRSWSTTRRACSPKLHAPTRIIVRNRTQVRGDAARRLAQRCRVVGRLGVGLDNIDVPACEAARA